MEVNKMNYALSLHQFEDGWVWYWSFEFKERTILLHSDSVVHQCIDCCYMAGRKWMEVVGPQDLQKFIEASLHKKELY